MRNRSIATVCALVSLALPATALAQAPPPVTFGATGFAPPQAPPPVMFAPPQAPPVMFAPPQAPPPLMYAPPGAPAPEITFEPSEPARDTTTPERPPAPRSWALDVGAETQFPLGVGGVVTAELPARILLQASFGVMPKGYAYAIDDFLTGVGAYDSTVSNLIRTSLGDSKVMRLSAGWRPFENHGLELMGGYELIALSGGAGMSDVINTALAESGSSQRVNGMAGADIPVNVTMHAFQVSLGWRWLLASDHIVLRANVSYLQCLASSTSITLADQTLQAQANQALGSFLSPYITTYVKMPTVGFSASYRF